MILVSALTYSDPQRPLSITDTQGWSERLASPRFPHSSAIQEGNAVLHVCGDESIDSNIYSAADVSLVCDADLLNAETVKTNEPSGGIAAMLAALYRQRGDDFVLDLEGTFAIIVFDHREKSLKAWTDRFGAGRLVFSSSIEFTAVSADLRLLSKLTGQQFAIDPVAILEYLQYACIPAPRTIFRGVSRLEAGSALRTKPTVQTRPYWNVTFEQSIKGTDESFWCREILSSVRGAVARAASVRQPGVLGCFLSGGTDSSSVTGLVGEIIGEKPRSFSIGFDDPRYNEIEYARIAAKRYGCEHHEYFVNPQDILSLIPKAIQFFDEPFGNASIVPTYYCARLAADNGVKTMLAGDGGDEIFAGNERYISDKVFERYGMLPAWSRSFFIEPLLRFASYKKGGLLGKASRYVNRANTPLPDRLYSYSFLSSLEREEIFTSCFRDQIAQADSLARARRHYQNAPSKDNLNRWLYLDLKMTISDSDVPKVTGMTRLAGVQVRYPFLDPDLVALAGRIPPGLKLKQDQLRYIFKKAMAPVLPREIVNKTKHGFGLPYGVWVGEHQALREFTFDILGSSSCRQRGYFRPDLLEWIWNNYQNVDRIFYGAVLWCFLVLEYWHINNEERQVTATRLN